MTRKSIVSAAALLLFFIPVFGAAAQDFGFSDESTAATSSFPFSVTGSLSASVTGFIDDIKSGPSDVSLGDLFSGKINISGQGTNGEGFLSIDADGTDVSIDQAYVGAFLGDFELEAGLRKLTWGRADSFGPLDIINPLDTAKMYTVMADSTDLNDIKIAVPLLHATYRIGEFSKIEAVFEPSFTPYSIATTGRWAAAQASQLSLYGLDLSDTSAFENLGYFQAGGRFTTTVGAFDLGLQYFYGYLPEPSVDVAINMATYSASYNLVYNPYHEVGLDLATSFAGFNVRAEAGANITSDLSGDDGSVYNPSLVGSLGFDRELFLDITLNMQVNESYRLMNDKVGTELFDIESGSDASATQIITTLSRYFMKGDLEARASAIVEVEDKDFLIMPALIWTKNDIKLSCAAGIFGGDFDGNLGEYKDNNFIKTSITYIF